MSFRPILLVCAFGALAAVAACGPTAAAQLTACGSVMVDLNSDNLNCGMCGSACGLGSACDNGVCGVDTCTPGASQSCYDGADGTLGVGPCKGGTKTCPASGIWGPCSGEVIPVPEVCGNGIDDNCNGMTDEDVDADGDGYTTCGGDCCDDTSLCSNPAMVNPGAYDVPGDGVDNDCDGMIDDDPAPCDGSLVSNSTTGTDYAKAIELCKSASTADPLKRWGVFSAVLTQTNGSGASGGSALAAKQSPQHAIRKAYGTGVKPKEGSSFVLLSTGAAAGTNDTNPGPDQGPLGDPEDGQYGAYASFPPDWFATHGSTLPNSPGCPAPKLGSGAGDPIMLTLSIRVPTNANSFTLETNFFSSEFPEFVCTQFNDFFVVLLDSTYSGTPANPSDKNLAFYTNSAGSDYPVGVNLADTGLFSQCVSGATGCAGSGSAGSATCSGSDELAGTGMDAADPGSCNNNSLIGGGTGWLLTTGNVTPGETMLLRIAIWDTSDDELDSLAVIDAFKWNADTQMPGTIIAREDPGLRNDPTAIQVDMPVSRLQQ